MSLPQRSKPSCLGSCGFAVPGVSQKLCAAYLEDLLLVDMCSTLSTMLARWFAMAHRVCQLCSYYACHCTQGRYMSLYTGEVHDTENGVQSSSPIDFHSTHGRCMTLKMEFSHHLQLTIAAQIVMYNCTCIIHVSVHRGDA